MTRSEQFELFHRYFDAENERYESLTTRASIYLSVITGLTLFAGLKLDEINKFISANSFTLVLAAISGLLVLAALAATVLSLRVYAYKDVCDVEDMVVQIDENKYDKEDIYSVLLANLADATKVNRAINDRRAHHLEWAVALLGLSVAAFIITNVAVVILFS